MRVLDCFRSGRGPSAGSRTYEGVDWYLGENREVVQSRLARTSIPVLEKTTNRFLREVAWSLLRHHSEPVKRMRSDKVWPYITKTRWFHSGVHLLRPSDGTPENEIWVLPAPELMGVYFGPLQHDGHRGIASFRGARVWRFRVTWADRFSRV